VSRATDGNSRRWRALPLASPLLCGAAQEDFRMRTLFALVIVAALANSARADSLVGTIHLPINFNGTLSGSVSELMPNQYYLQWRDYVSTNVGTTVRFCAAWTDSGSGSDQISLGLWYRANSNSWQALAYGTFQTTWSGSALYHQQCGPKFVFYPPLDGTCGSSWYNGCFIDGDTNGNTIPVIVKDAWIEIWR
jgi:hypothetical protein